MARVRNNTHTLKYARHLGYDIDTCERWVPMAGGHGIRKDLFGIIDAIALHRGGVIGIQSTSMGEAAGHVRKAVDEPLLRKWLAHCQFEIWAWATIVPPAELGLGKRKRLSVRRISMAMRSDWTLSVFSDEIQVPDWTAMPVPPAPAPAEAPPATAAPAS